MRLRVATLVILGLLAAACSAGATAPVSSPTPSAARGATTADEFAAAVCSSLRAMNRAWGNPDTGSASDLAQAMDAAIAAGDSARIDAAATQVAAELASARAFAGSASGWQPGGAFAAQLDKLMAAFEAHLAAKRSNAGGGADQAKAAAQTAFEQAGGVDAWRAMFGGSASVSLPPDALQLLGTCRWWEASPAPSLSASPVG